MGLLEWADEHDYEIKAVPLREWLENHPDVLAEIVEAREGSARLPFDVIATWLLKAHGFKTNRRSLSEAVRAFKLQESH